MIFTELKQKLNPLITDWRRERRFCLTYKSFKSEIFFLTLRKTTNKSTHHKVLETAEQYCVSAPCSLSLLKSEIKFEGYCQLSPNTCTIQHSHTRQDRQIKGLFIIPCYRC